MLEIKNNKIQRGFNGSAKKYDLYSQLHRNIADKLLANVIKGPVPTSVLDVGCGTGYLTAKLKAHFPSAQIVGIDEKVGVRLLYEAFGVEDGEEVLADDEHTLSTPHPKLRIARARSVEKGWMEGLLVWLDSASCTLGRAGPGGAPGRPGADRLDVLAGRHHPRLRP